MPKAEKKSNPLIEEVQQDAALIQVWERRLANPLQAPISDIRLSDPNFELHWVDTGTQGRFHIATREQGWVPVRPNELADTPDVLGLEDRGDGYVRRGIRGEEVLMKIPKKIAEAIRNRKASAFLGQLKRSRENIAQAAAVQFGSEEAAAFAMGQLDPQRHGTSGLKGTLVDKLGPEDLD